MQHFFLFITLPISLTFLLIALWDYRRTQKLITNGKRATGHYVGFERDIERGEGAISITEYSRIEFTTETNSIVQFQGRTGTVGRGKLVGREVEVFYDPQVPANARVNSFTELWMFALIFGSVGIGLLIVTPIFWLILN